MSKRCRQSILCLARRGRCCLGGAVVVKLHFRHFRIALASAEASQLKTKAGSLADYE